LEKLFANDHFDHAGDEVDNKLYCVIENEIRLPQNGTKRLLGSFVYVELIVMKLVSHGNILYL